MIGFVQAEAAETVGVGELSDAAELVHAERSAEFVGDFEKRHADSIAIPAGRGREAQGLDTARAGR